MYLLEIEVHSGPPTSCGEVTLAHQGTRTVVGFSSDFSFLLISLLLQSLLLQLSSALIFSAVEVQLSRHVDAEHVRTFPPPTFCSYVSLYCSSHYLQ